MSKYKLQVTNRFKKDLKLCLRRGLPMDELENVVNILLSEGCLPAKYRPHKLSGELNDIWECHIRTDWLLLWKQDDESLIMLMTNTGTHADIFG